MVSFQELDYHGLRVKVTPRENEVSGYHYPHRYLFLTGMDGLFEVTVTNMTAKKRAGKFGLVFFYPEYNNQLIQYPIVEFEVKPLSVFTAGLTVYHIAEGQVMCKLPDIGTPESFIEMSDEEVEKKIGALKGKILCAYKVIDQVTWDEETRRFDELRSEIKNLEERLTTQIDQTIKARLSELGLKPEVGRAIAEIGQLNQSPTNADEEKKTAEKKSSGAPPYQ